MLNRFAAFFVIVLIGLLPSIGCAQHQTHVHSVSDRKHGYLGVNASDVTERLKNRKHITVDQGAYVEDVVEESPAEKAGIEEGDVIVKVGDRTIEDSDDLIKAVRKLKPETEVKIELVRKAEHKSVTATLDRAPSSNFSFNFNGNDLRLPRVPRIPSTPRAFHFRMFSSEEMEGLSLEPLSKQLAEYFEVPGGRGLLVTEVKKGSDAEQAGFKAGDVVTKVNGSTVRDMDDIREELDNQPSGKSQDVPFDVIRKGKPVTLKMKVESEDDNDDYSSTGFYHSPHMMIYRHGRPNVDASRFDEFKGQMREFGKNLREELQDLRERLREELRGL